MPSNFDDQLERLLHRYADPVQPTRDIFSQIQLRLRSQTRSRRALLSGRRMPMSPLVATVSLVVVIALFGALFLSLRGGNGPGGLSCAPMAVSTMPAGGAASALKAGDTVEVTRAYVGDDFIVIDYRITVSATSPIASSAEFVPNFYLRDKQGQYVTNNGGPGATPSYDGDSVVYTGTAVFPPFAQPEEAGAQTLFFGWFPFFRADRANGGLEGAFQSTVVRGAVSHPHVTPAKASGLTLQLVDLSINRTPNPIMTPAIESVRLHLRYSGLPTAPAYDTLVMNSFHSDVMGGSGNGDQSALTLPDGVSGPPAFANLAGRQHFIAGYPMVGCPTIGCIELGPKDEGQMDMMAVFYVSHIPQDGALIFTLDELHFSYEWDSSLDGQPQRSHGYSYADPWTLTIPLSGA